MYRAITAEQSRELERDAVASGVSLGSLMSSAGEAVASLVSATAPDGDVVILAGPGNNGGDGWVAARSLVARGRSVRVFSFAAVEKLREPASQAAREAMDSGVAWTAVDGPPAGPVFESAAVVIDAMLGTGSRLPIREPMRSWCRALRDHDAYVVAVDMPTGVDADTGDADGAAVYADSTVTFIQPKLGLVTHPGAAFAGEVVVADLGIPYEVAARLSKVEIWSDEDIVSSLPVVLPDAHKNQRGRVLVVAGSTRFAGAAVLCARGAMRMGAGYVTLAVPEPVVAVAQGHLTAAPVVGLPAGRSGSFSASAAASVLDLASDHDAVVVGPGLTLVDGAVALARAIVRDLSVPLVIDADALNAFVDASELLSSRATPTVLTPHPGELARLLDAATADIQHDRISSAGVLALGRTAVVLKGAGTVVSHAGRSAVVTAGTPALATAGTGDVLAGMIGTLLARHLDPFVAGLVAAHIHGRAGEAAAARLTPLCVTAEDIPDHIPVAVSGLLEAW